MICSAMDNKWKDCGPDPTWYSASMLRGSKIAPVFVNGDLDAPGARELLACATSEEAANRLTRRTNWREMDAWYRRGCGVAAACGPVSGGLECVNVNRVDCIGPVLLSRPK